MRTAILLLLLSSCAAPTDKLCSGSVPTLPGYLPAYPEQQWTMALYEVGTQRFAAQIGGYQSQADCQEDTHGLGNPDVYGVCRP